MAEDLYLATRVIYFPNSLVQSILVAGDIVYFKQYKRGFFVISIGLSFKEFFIEK